MDPKSLLDPAAIIELSRRVSTPVRPVKEVRALRDGSEAFPVMLDLIGSATKSVWFENFIFAGDATGQRFARALGKAVRRGVEVRVLYDPVGTMMVKGGSIASGRPPEKMSGTGLVSLGSTCLVALGSNDECCLRFWA